MKRHFALILTLLLLLMPVMHISAAEDDGADMAFLKGVGILEENFTSSTIYVTRAEAAMILTRCAAAIPGASEQIFADVPKNLTYASEIALAYKLGIISGFGDGTFQPNRSVTYAQMVKMLVTLAGYGQVAEAQGGYPAGYLTVAAHKNIIVFVEKADKPLNYSEMAKLVRAALEAPIAEGVSYETDYMERKETGKDMLSAWHGIETINGLVTANYLSVLSAERTVKQDEVAIDDKVYKNGTSAAPSYMCREVRAYIKKSTETVLYAEVRSGSTELTVDAEDILSATKEKLVYERDGKDESVQLSGAVLIKNGVVIPDWVSGDIRLLSGRLRLVSNSGNDVDYIIAEQFVNRIVESVNEATKTVRFKDGGTLVIDTDNTVTKTVFEEVNGRPASLAYTYPMDVFSVMESTDVLKIVRSAALVIGEIEEISSESISINGKEYKICPAFLQSEEFENLSLGMIADFYLDYTGKLAAVDTATGTLGTYGLLISGVTKAGISAEVQLKIFTSEGEMKGFAVADNVLLNGGSVKEAELLSSSSPLLAGGTVERQLVQYGLNDSNEINEIRTAVDFSANPDDEARLHTFSKDGYIDENRKMNGETMTFRDDEMQIFNNRFRVKNGVTKIFVVPAVGGADEDYNMISADSLLGGSQAGINVNMTFYEVTENYLISVIVWEKAGGGKTEPNHEMDYMAVSSVYMGLDSEGIPNYNIEGYTMNGAVKKLTVEEGFESYFRMVYTDKAKDDPALFDGDTPKNMIPATAIRPGDLIQFQATNAGTATLLNVVARGGSLSQGELYYNGYTSGQSEVYRPSVFGLNYTYSIACSTIQRSDKDCIVTKIVKPGQDPLIRVYPSSGCNLLFDSKKGTMTKISMNDMQPGDIVLTAHASQTMRFAIVYR